MQYTRAHIEFIQECTDTGDTAAEVAAAFAEAFGIKLSRNAIIGLWDRGRVKRVPEEARAARAASHARMQRRRQLRDADKTAAKEAAVAKEYVSPSRVRVFPKQLHNDRDKDKTIPRSNNPWPVTHRLGEGVPFVLLKDESFTQPGMCRYPFAAYAEVATRFCGRVAVPGSVWCSYHKRYVYKRAGRDDD